LDWESLEVPRSSWHGPERQGRAQRAHLGGPCAPGPAAL